MKGYLVVAGHICLDITPVLPNHAPYANVGALLSPGSLIRTDGVRVHTGGCVSNTGLALKALGSDVRLVGKRGDDAFGTLLMERLGEAGENVIVGADDATSYTVVLAIPGLDRIFLHDPGANDTFCADDVSDAVLSDAGLMHFGYPTLMRRMMADGGAELTRLFARAHARGVATSLDLASVDPNAQAGRVDWRAYLRNVLPETDIFTPSFEEVCFMLDRQRHDALCVRGEEALDWERDVLPLSDTIMALGCKLLLLKCGEMGMLLRTADAEALSGLPERMELDVARWANLTHVQHSYPAEIVRSATGAGDVSIAAFLLALSRGYAPKECAALAAMEGARAVTTYDALSGLVPLETLAARIR